MAQSVSHRFSLVNYFLNVFAFLIVEMLTRYLTFHDMEHTIFLYHSKYFHHVLAFFLGKVIRLLTLRGIGE